jgi:hypothetical protein
MSEPGHSKTTLKEYAAFAGLIVVTVVLGFELLPLSGLL